MSEAAVAPDPLLAALPDVVAAIATGFVAIPPVSGLAPLVVARALYRSAIRGDGWVPFVHVHTRHLGPEGLPRDVASQAAGGWLFVEGPGAASHVVRGSEVRCVAWTEDAPPREMSEADIAQIQGLDALHTVATDPALEAVRSALLAHCRASGTVHLSGEPGTSRVALARWAHVTLDDRPLSWIRAGQGALRPGEWALVEEPAELHPEQREAVARLAAVEPPSPPRPRGPPIVRPRHPALRAILGESSALAEVLLELLRVAPTDLPVLVVGEPGTGKESLAAAVHHASGRSGPLVAIDVGALPPDLAESELFGHRRGAFTGAERPRLGAFRAADKGTLFLDELGNLAPRLQVKLLRVLQERRVQPIGEDAPVPIDVRIVTATNADLPAMVRRGAFREDLLGRLDAVTLRLPPLRERLDDLDVLASGLLGRPAPWCTEEARRILLRHRFPGNIRELGNVLRYAAAVCPPGALIAAEHLGPLSPRIQRRTPTIIVSGGSTDGWGLDRRTVAALTVATLAMPPVRERGDASRRAAILAAVGGRPVETTALDRLARRPWWGNQPEIDAFAAALQALPPGPVTLERLRQLLSGAGSAGEEAPIYVVLLPALDADGRLVGLVREVRSGAALIGRMRHARELAGPDARIQAAAAVVAARAPQASVGVVDLSLLPQLSRAHLLIARDEGGLSVHVLPGAALPATAGPLCAEALHPCGPDAGVSIGTAGEIVLSTRAGDTIVRIYVFLGEVALAEHGPLAVARSTAARTALDATVGRPPPAAPPVEAPGALVPLPRSASPRPSGPASGFAEGAPRPAEDGPAVTSSLAARTLGSRVWTLNAEERAALVELIVGYESGQLKAHVHDALPAWQGRPGLGRLARYLEEAPRLSQYLSRLVEHDENAPVRAALAERLLALPDADTRLELLPKGIRDGILAAAGHSDW